MFLTRITASVLSFLLLAQYGAPGARLQPMRMDETPQAPLPVLSRPANGTAPRVADLNGLWDMRWRQDRERIQHASMRIDQNGLNVVVSIRSSDGHDFDGAKGMKGTFDGADLFFVTRPLSGPSVTFHGNMKNGLIVGTTEVGLSWFAMRHFD